MERFEVGVTVRKGSAGRAVLLHPRMLERLGATERRPWTLRFGTRRVAGSLKGEPGLAEDQVLVPAPMAEALGLPPHTRLTIWQEARTTLACGPLLGYVTSRAALRALRSGDGDPLFARLAAAAHEAGSVLIVFSPNDIRWERAAVRAEQIEAPAGGPVRREGGFFPLPRVILYPTAVADGPTPRQLAAQARSLDCTVLSHRKIRKLETYQLLQRVPELRSYLPYTDRLTPESLARAMRRYADLYLKPDDLSKGRGVHRLTRLRSGGWLLSHRGTEGNVERVLADVAAVRSAIVPLLRNRSVYLIQEGLPLATYLGNRFDMRALVQRNGAGRWTVSGVAARIAPVGSAITSPRSGGLVASPEQVLRHVFADRGRAVLAAVQDAALAVARAIDAGLGPVYELGIDLGVLQDGTVRLIEVNGMPLKVSLRRLGDPFADQRMDRCPVHYAAWLDLGGNRR